MPGKLKRQNKHSKGCEYRDDNDNENPNVVTGVMIQAETGK